LRGDAAASGSRVRRTVVAAAVREKRIGRNRGSVLAYGDWIVGGGHRCVRTHGPRLPCDPRSARRRVAASPRKKHSALSGAGHPRSRNYSDGHNAWVAGEPTPFMPGQSVTRLVLKPR